MEYRYLTGTGLYVSRLSLGTMTFGSQVGQEEASQMCSYAFEQGINFIDTANCYNNTASETMVGEALSGQRDRWVLATKVGTPYENGKNLGGFSRSYILKELEGSLKRLKTDYVDLFYLHTPDYHTPFEETLDIMSNLVRDGKARYIGISNHAAWQVARMRHTCDKRNLIPPVVSQMVFNAITRGIEQEYVPFSKAYGMGLIVYNPLAAGILSGKYSDRNKIENTRFAMDQKYSDRYWNEDSLNAAGRLTEIAQKAGMSLLELAIRWCLSHDYVDSLLLGFSTMGQLEQNIKCWKGNPLPADVMTECDKVWAEISGNRFKYNR